MNTKHLSTGVACGIFVLTLAAAVSAQAQSPEDSIQFPVAELGNCGSKEECKAYCDEPGNMEACISFAEKNGLMPPEEIEMAKKFIAAGASGPGGCTGKDSCEAYCNDINNIDACVSFAEENGMMSGDELAEAKKVQAAIRSGVKPPPCGGKQACDAYCESPENMPACMEFALAAGLMSAEEQANAQMMLKAIQSGAKPPACRGKEECDAYCGQEENFNECVEFGKAAGFMTDAEYEMAKKTGGKGPGGCRGKEACDALCSQPENEEMCIAFAMESGMWSEEQKRQMEEGNQRFRESFGNMPPEVKACLTEKWGGAEVFEKLKSGAMRPTQRLGEAMQPCFQQFEEERMRQESQMRETGPQGPEGSFGPMDPGQYGPPSGCEGEECRPPEGMMGGPRPEGMPGFPGPEGTMGPPSQEQMEEYRQQMTEEYQRQMMEQGGYGGEPGQPMPQQYGPPPGYEGGMMPYPAPEGGMMPPTGGDGSFSGPYEGQGGVPMPAPAPEQGAPASETAAPVPAPAPVETITVPADSLAGAVILFLRGFGL